MANPPLINPLVPQCLSLPAETTYAPQGIVSRTVMTLPGVRVVLFGIAAGQELSEHRAPYHAMVQVLAGECEFRVAGEGWVLKAGDLLSMPPEAPHSLRARTDFAMLLTLVPPGPAGGEG